MEMLVVLAIFMVISCSLLYVSSDKLKNYTNEQIIDQTELVMRLAQIRAIETKSSYKFLAFNCRDLTVRSTASKGEILFVQILPQGMEVHITAHSNAITFLPNGNISGAGSIVYHLKDYAHKFSVNMGKGRLILKSVQKKSEGANTCGYAFGRRDFIFSYVDAHPTDV